MPVVAAETTPGRAGEYRFSLPQTLKEALARAGMQRVILSRMDNAPLQQWLQFGALRYRLVAPRVPQAALPTAVLITLGTQKAVVKLDLAAPLRTQVAAAAVE